jgi:hypothetical protein
MCPESITRVQAQSTARILEHIRRSKKLTHTKAKNLPTDKSQNPKKISCKRCWNLYGLGSITNYKISNKSQRPIHVSKRMWELFSVTLIVEVDVAILKYGSPGEGRTAPAWMVRRNPAPRLVGAWSPFAVLVFGFLAFKLQSSKRLQIKSPKTT